jgi:hypothetical protein
MAACFADTAHLVSLEEVEEIEIRIANEPESPAKDLLRRLCATVRALNKKLRSRN